MESPHLIYRKRPHTHSSSKSGQGIHNQKKSKKDRMRFYNFFHEDHYVHPDNIFEAIFGEHGFTWSHISWDGFRFRNTSSRFRWIGESQRERGSSESADESEDDKSEAGTSIGSHAHRVILGLPPCGPLTLDDVKTAFRASALRWHLDRHSGTSQAVAEETHITLSAMSSRLLSHAFQSLEVVVNFALVVAVYQGSGVENLEGSQSMDAVAVRLMINLSQAPT